MTKKEFMEKHDFNDLDFRNLKRYEQVRANGEMNMFEYLAMMRSYNLNGGNKLATWISSSNNYAEFMKVLENEKNMKGKVIPTWANKPLKVSDLLKICRNAVDNGLGDKYVFISQDDEGNGFHALFYSFTTQVKDYADLIYQVNDEDLEDIIILG